ncbi:lantibiotic dehydratase [Solwaraspora sp. WMMD1047]|uniref:lantibiotic dehydratase n=1 Tax=Solwaraspora sp. WMMD1047 TaxID=3016102 RepID=UPI002417183D|nr:lantibiotic dehydratase [Solwaraspora sp. WMMD1047]MDG4834107.1 lantibiotic dehydratase [Solwaraspora sp. WMMD1047]
MFRALDAAMIRVAAHSWLEGAVPWPHQNDAAGIEAWLRTTWRKIGLAEAIWAASPEFADRVEAVLAAGNLGVDPGWRMVLTVARYLVRAQRRATPFGLFSGVASLRFATAAVSGRPVVQVRPDASWLASLVARLEADPDIRCGLSVQANNLALVRGSRIVVTCRPHAFAPADGTASIRYTEAVRLAVSLTSAPMLWAELVDKVTAGFPEFPRAAAEALVADLVNHGVLICALRPPSTTMDPITHVLDHLDVCHDDGPDKQRTVRARLRALQGRLGASAGGVTDLRGLANEMRCVAAVPQPLAVDLRLGDQVVLPRQVAAEIVTSADVLRRLTPDPAGQPEWRAYHARFVDRYGMAAVVPLAQLVDPMTGLGFPDHVSTANRALAATLSGRDERLLALAQQAVIDGVDEVVLDDAAVRALAGTERDEYLVSPHVDVCAEVRAISLKALDEGRFTVALTGIGRSAMATGGRFLDVLTDAERERMCGEFARLPVAVERAMPAQLSFPPRNLHAQNVLRSRQVLPWLVSLAEHRPVAEDVISLDDLGVAAGRDRLVVVSMSRRRVVEPTVAHAAALHAIPLLGRFLVELPRALDARLKPFDWGAAACLPFRPALRYGRVLLSAARWRVEPARLPGADAGDGEWSAAWEQLRARLGLPRWVQVGSGDQRLRLDLDQAMDRSLLRAHLDASRGPVTIASAAGPEDFGWLSGRAHEVVVPVASTAAPAAVPSAIAVPARWPPPAPAAPVMPGASGVVSASLVVDPSLMELVVLRGLPALLAGWPEPPLWWFVRMRRPFSHLRLRLHTDSYGGAAERVGRWAAGLRQRGVAGDLSLDTYHPESGRYGDGPAMSAAEALFAADSRVALAQIAAKDTTRIDQQALTAASMVDLACAMLGSRSDGCEWLVARPEPSGRSPIDRAVLRQAAILDPTSLPEPIRHAWRDRSRAAARYADALSTSGGCLTPAVVLASLVHLHFVRVHGPDEAAEQVTYRLARHVALASVRRRVRTTGASR